jgi:cysteine desulfurase
MRFKPWVIGGGQENGRRSGTENVPGIVAIGTAARLMANDLHTGVHHRVTSMRNTFESSVIHHLPDSVINGVDAPRLGTTTSLTLTGLDAAGLLILLDKAGVCCSAGSACHTASVHPSHVLEAMGLDRAHAASTLRFSFCRDNTASEIDEAVAALVGAAQKLRLLRG